MLLLNLYQRGSYLPGNPNTFHIEHWIVKGFSYFRVIDNHNNQPRWYQCDTDNEFRRDTRVFDTGEQDRLETKRTESLPPFFT